MIYPENFERKIGFNEIRTLLKGRCLSSLGTEWVDKELHFMHDFEQIKQALDEAREYKIFEEQTDEEVETEFFDVREALLRARPERTFLEELDLFNLKRSIASVLSYAKLFTQKVDDEALSTTDADTENNRGQIKYLYPALGKMACDVAVFPDIIRRIDNILNKYGKVKDTASPELLSLRHQIEITTRGISHSLRSIINEAQTSGYIDRDVTPTLRDGRLVIPVAPALKRKIKGIVHDESATGKTVFIEPSAVVDANNKIRTLRAAERREVIRILQEITIEIRPHIPELISSLHFLAHVDFLRALNAFSNSFGAIVPNIQPKPSISWMRAIHPLLQHSLAKHGGMVVPLDVELRPGQRILLISGPNAGGKSVCLKTVGLLQYMLQCGMPVPAGEDSCPGIFDDIMIDIGDEQSIENDLSTYSSHLQNMKVMMKSANSRSLLLIDEFGGGTEPQIGGAMAQAILKRFIDNLNFGIITTHYQNLKHFAEQTRAVVNGAMLYDSKLMQPLFKLKVGNPGSSFAIEIARKMGIPADVIDYASKLVGKDYVMSDKYVQDIVRNKEYWEAKRRNITLKEQQLESTIARYEREMTDFQLERKRVMADAKAEAKHLIEKSNARIENTIRNIREAQAEKEKTKNLRNELAEFKTQIETDTDEQDRIARKIAKIQRRQQRKADGGDSAKAKSAAEQKIAATKLRNLSNSCNSQSSVSPSNNNKVLRAGSYVRIIGQSSIGRIESISGKSARVLFGMLYTQVPVSRLEPCEAPKEENTALTQNATFVSKETRDAMYEKRLHFKPEIDIRGMHIDEALTAVSYFIDDAIQLEQSKVRILHGTGTGALRELVRNYLKTVPGVKHFHDEHVQFGGAGITVVDLA
ncbi:Smr/MutS family protein [Prevotellamassilia timonensis]|uniref:endonuclease MutS2 n=1 Tax=Prevotellamassilia timonensis TaxID=1852370 RepID=UPI00307D07EC